LDRAPDARLVALAVLLEAAGLLTMAAAVVPAAHVGLAGYMFDLGAEGLRVALEGGVNRPLALVVILRVVVAPLAIAREAILPRGEALAVQLEAARVAAVALLARLVEARARRSLGG